MLNRLRRPGAVPAVMLIIIILWAFLAVLFLTSTLISAGQIDNRVDVINGEVGPIDNELDAVTLAKKTGDISGQIRQAAAPLGGQLTQTNESVRGIDGSAKKILGNAGLINGSAKEINATVQQINGNVNTIGSTLNSVEGSATSINGSVDGINASFGGVMSEVVSIDDGAAGINQRAEIVSSRSRGIAANVAEVTDVHLPAIIANSAAIEGSPLLLRNADAAGILNQLAAARALQTPEAPESGLPGAPALPGIAGLPAPVRLPAPRIDEILPVGPQQSAENDSGSVLGSVVGGL